MGLSSWFLVLALFVTLRARADQIPGGVTPVGDLNGTDVVDSAKFAVLEHNKHTRCSQLIFLKVINGTQQTAEGLKYNLVILAMDGATTKSYEALVWDRPWETQMERLSFTPIGVMDVPSQYIAPAFACSKIRGWSISISCLFC